MKIDLLFGQILALALIAICKLGTANYKERSARRGHNRLYKQVGVPRMKHGLDTDEWHYMSYAGR